MGICDRAGLGLRGKIFALAMMFSSTAILAWIGEGKIELFGSSLGLAGISLLVPFRSGAPIARRDLVIAGLLVGFAITCKLILALCLAVMAAILLGWALFGEALASLRVHCRWVEHLWFRLSFRALFSASLCSSVSRRIS